MKTLADHRGQNAHTIRIVMREASTVKHGLASAIIFFAGSLFLVAPIVWRFAPDSVD